MRAGPRACPQARARLTDGVWRGAGGLRWVMDWYLPLVARLGCARPPMAGYTRWSALGRSCGLTPSTAESGVWEWSPLRKREEIAFGIAAGDSMRTVARRLGRAPSMVSRELGRDTDRKGCYRATRAHALAWDRASRPKPAKLAFNLQLRQIVERELSVSSRSMGTCSSDSTNTDD